MAVSTLAQAGPTMSSACPSLPLVDVSVVIPCLSEEEGIGWVIDRAYEGLLRAELLGEIIVVDNGSKDRTAEIAEACGATVVVEDRRGYGYAYQRGFMEARGDIVVMRDGDGTYDLASLPEFVDAIQRGADLVLGARLDGMEPGAMPLLHRFVGNPFFSWLFSAAFALEISDVNSGMRAFRRHLFPPARFSQGGMEFALEMLVVAARDELRVVEIPISYKRRQGESKLRTWRDGWRSLSYLLGSKLKGPSASYSPRTFTHLT